MIVRGNERGSWARFTRSRQTLDWCVCWLPSAEVSFCLHAPKTLHERYKAHSGVCSFSSSRIAGLKQYREVVWRRRSNEPRLRMGSYSATGAVLQSLHKIVFLIFHNFRCSSFIQIPDQPRSDEHEGVVHMELLSGPFLDFPPPSSGFSIDRFQRGELPQPIKHLPLQASDTATQQQTRGYRVISHASKSSQEPPSRIPSARKAGSPVKVRLPDPGIPPYFP
ncbi:hypothetical protein V8E51_014160 [Hyaloscypha variabilis]